MPNTPEASTSLAERIIEELLDTIANERLFDQELVDRLTQLAQKGELRKPNVVLNTIKSSKGPRL